MADGILGSAMTDGFDGPSVMVWPSDDGSGASSGTGGAGGVGMVTLSPDLYSGLPLNINYGTGSPASPASPADSSGSNQATPATSGTVQQALDSVAKTYNDIISGAASGTPMDLLNLRSTISNLQGQLNGGDGSSSPGFVDRMGQCAGLLHVDPQGINQSYNLALNNVGAPGNSWPDNVTYGAGAAAMFPANLVEEFGRGIINIPSDFCGAFPAAAKAGADVGAASDTSQPADVRVAAGLNAVKDGAAAFNGLVGPAATVDSLVSFATSKAPTSAEAEVNAPDVTIEPKIAGQMNSRGWPVEDVKAIIANPDKIVEARDTRFDESIGAHLDEPATGYVNKDGSYVVVNNNRGTVVQVSNKNDPDWKAPWQQ